MFRSGGWWCCSRRAAGEVRVGSFRSRRPAVYLGKIYLGKTAWSLTCAWSLVVRASLCRLSRCWRRRNRDPPRHLSRWLAHKVRRSETQPRQCIRRAAPHQKNQSAGVTRVVPHGASIPSPISEADPQSLSPGFEMTGGRGGAAGFVCVASVASRALSSARAQCGRPRDGAGTRGTSEDGDTVGFGPRLRGAVRNRLSVGEGANVYRLGGRVLVSWLVSWRATPRSTIVNVPIGRHNPTYTLTCSSHDDATCHTETKHGPSRGPASPDFLSHPCLRLPCRLSRFPSPAQPY